MANLMGWVFWGWKPGTRSGWLSCECSAWGLLSKIKFGEAAALTIEISNAVIAEPCDRPMIPSYWFCDSSSDHHFTYLYLINSTAQRYGANVNGSNIQYHPIDQMLSYHVRDSYQGSTKAERMNGEHYASEGHPRNKGWQCLIACPLDCGCWLRR